MRVFLEKFPTFLVFLPLIVTFYAQLSWADPCEIHVNGPSLTEADLKPANAAYKDSVIKAILVQATDSNETAQAIRTQYDTALESTALADRRQVTDEERLKVARAILWDRPWYSRADLAVQDVRLTVAVQSFGVAENFQRPARIEAARSALKSGWIRFNRFSAQEKAEVEFNVCQMLNLGCESLFSQPGGSRPYWKANTAF